MSFNEPTNPVHGCSFPPMRAGSRHDLETVMSKRKIHPAFRAEYARWDRRRQKVILAVLRHRAKFGCGPIVQRRLERLVCQFIPQEMFGAGVTTRRVARRVIREMVERGRLTKVGSRIDYPRRLCEFAPTLRCQRAFDRGLQHAADLASAEKRDGGSLTVLNPAPAKPWATPLRPQGQARRP